MIGVLLIPLALGTHHILSAVCAHVTFFWAPIVMILEFIFYLLVCFSIKRFIGLQCILSFLGKIPMAISYFIQFSLKEFNSPK